MYKKEALALTADQLATQTVAWRSPSNIALVKYWGKYGRQYPKNPSISFTLQNCCTETSIRSEAKEDQENISLDFTFEKEKNPAFETRIKSFLSSITDFFPFLKQVHLSIQSKNSFPHSSGIASSASSMSALALGLCSLEKIYLGGLEKEADFYQKASFMARLGSGSAARSVFSKAALWGKTSAIPASANEYAIPYNHLLHSSFQDFQDAILIVHKGPKKVSSSAGHALMNNHLYAEVRYRQAFKNIVDLAQALETGDLDIFGKIVEEEALALHSMMMTSSDSFILMAPNTLAIIDEIRTYRADTKIPIFFTLDAGPNVHILYPKEVAAQVKVFIESHLLNFCEEKYWIADQMGDGPQQIEQNESFV